VHKVVIVKSPEYMTTNFLERVTINPVWGNH